MKEGGTSMGTVSRGAIGASAGAYLSRGFSPSLSAEARMGAKSSIISRSEVTKGFNPAKSMFDRSRPFVSFPSPSKARTTERHVARPSFERSNKERVSRVSRVSRVPRADSDTRVPGVSRVSRADIAHKASETRVSSVPRAIEQRVNTAPRPTRLDHSTRNRPSRETVMKPRTIISLRTEAPTQKRAPKKDVFSHVGRQEMRLQRMSRVESPVLLKNIKVEARKSVQAAPRTESKMSPAVKKDFRSLVFSRIKTAPYTSAALSIDLDVKQAEKVARIKQAIYPKLSEPQVQTMMVNSLVELYKKKAGVVISPEVQPDVQPKTEVQNQVDTLVPQKIGTATLLQSEENKKKVEKAVLKNPEDQHKEKKKFYFVEDVKAKAERIKAAILAASHLLKYRKGDTLPAGKDLVAQMGQLGGNAISEVAHPGLNDGTIASNMQELGAMGAFNSEEEVAVSAEKTKAKPIKLSTLESDGKANLPEAQAVYGGSLLKKPAYFEANNRASGKFDIDEEGALWFVPETPAVAGQVA